MFEYPKKYNIVVVGGGHAGCEASLATSRMGFSTLLLTINLDTIAQMSCNPSIGGLAKGHLVREIDALGGMMAKIIDQTSIQFRMLNTRKGPAVWAPRAQADKKAYQFTLKKVVESQANLDVKQELVTDIIVKNRKARGVVTRDEVKYLCDVLIICPGTFLRGLIHIGETSFPSGRAGEIPSMKLSESLESLGIELGRLKTGTPPRINGRTIDYSKVELQPGESMPYHFSHDNIQNKFPQIPCYITYSTKKTADIITANLHRSPLYGGRIKGIGPRYCPSIEDKIVRFPHHERHQIFLEPEGVSTEEVYVNGAATSLPFDVQVEMIHSIDGLEDAEIMRPGYAVEYDFAFPTQINPSLETKAIENLFFAGQINGTSGYEEAAAQGLMAGINAVQKLKGEEPFYLDRSQAYIGVLIDDLVTKGTKEPYRMFTSRAEYRLLLRQDNADTRLLEYGHKFSLISDEQFAQFDKKRNAIQAEVERLKKTFVDNTPLSRILTRPEKSYSDLRREYPETVNSCSSEVEREIELEIKYEGYINKQKEQVARFQKMEKMSIPSNINYAGIKGLRNEAVEKLAKIQPQSLGQASRISGINPADISILMVYLKKIGAKKNQ